MQGLFTSQSQKVQQEQTLAPHQLQSLDILAAALPELEARIQTELEQNPVLEVEEPEILSSGSDELPLPRENESLDENRDGFNESLEQAMTRAMTDDQDFEDKSFFQIQSESDADEEKRQWFFDSISQEQFFQEQLLEQLRFSDCPPALRSVAEEIIGNIGDSGYFESATAEVAQICGCSLDEAEEALRLIQTFDPPGIGARDLKECLLLQVERDPEKYPPRLPELIRDHLDDIAKNRLPQTAKAMNITIEELSELTDSLKHLNPHPGSTAAPGATAYIRPEVAVSKNKDGEFTVTAIKEVLPRLLLSRTYLDMLEDPATPDEAKTYIREKIVAAKQLMHNIDQRESTVCRIAKLILSAQYDYFEQGDDALRPMTMREIADKIGRDESTVSRAISGKYMQTPRGVVALRDFFGGGYKREDGEEVSVRGIKEIIRDAVADEDPASPLSDSRIEAILKEQGFTVARRTIAKYREELGIPSSQLRKVYQ